MQQCAHGQGSSKALPPALLDVLASQLLQQDLTSIIAVYFSPILVDLAARLLPADSQGSWQDGQIQATVHAFATLLAPFPAIYPMVYRLLHHPALHSEPLYAILPILERREASRLLLSIARLGLASAPLLYSFKSQLPPAALETIFQDRDGWPAAARLLAVQLFSQSQGLPEQSRSHLERRYVGRPSVLPPSESAQAELGLVSTSQEDETDAFLQVVAGDGQILETVDVWILPLSEQRRKRAVHDELQVFLPGFSTVTPSFDLCDSIVDVAGVLLPRIRQPSPPHARPSSFVVTSSLQPTLNCLAQAFVQRLPILLSGPPSSGKSSLLEHLSLSLCPPAGPSDSQLVTLQLGDHSSLDAKALIGSYTSSARNPGTFEWVEGALTRAVRTGKWLVLEDIDKATSEILSVVKPLVEAMGPYKPLGALPELDLGPKGKVKAGPSFALFAVRSAVPPRDRSGGSSIGPATFMTSNHCTEVTCGSPTDQDVAVILQQRYPALAQNEVLGPLISAWKTLQRASTSSRARQIPAGSRRVPMLRDLMKWCHRIAAFAGDQAHSLFTDQRKLERVFLEGAEVFMGAVPPPDATTIAATQAQSSYLYEDQMEALATALGLSPTRDWRKLIARTPELTLRGSSDALDQSSGPAKLRVGRIELPRRIEGDSTSAGGSVSRSFAMTRPAALLLERIAASIAMSEPVLLVGETGTGKTTSLQHLAARLGQPMVALNLSQQTEASDLLGAYKPLEPRLPAMELHNQWYDLFERTFSAKRNARFIDLERKALQGGKWARLVTLWQESIKMAIERRQRKAKLASSNGETTTHKKRRTDQGSAPGSPSADEARAEDALNHQWDSFTAVVSDFAAQHASRKRNFVLSFVEGPLVKALREGHWVLLDEVNLAASETLDALASLLQSADGSITLFERGDIEPIPRHPNFRLFACMNPATDVGKKDLPANLRSRFTELYVQSPDSDREALVAIVEGYIGHLSAGKRSVIMDVADAYAEIRRMASEHLLADGANQRPHFSIRTLARALTFAADQSTTFDLRRALWEGFIMAFTMLLDDRSGQMVRALLDHHIMSGAGNAKQVASFVPAKPKKGKSSDGDYVQIGPFWLQTGPNQIDPADEYVLTASVQSKLVGLARAIVARKSPVLIQGPTSAGKTSAVEYLARRTGHRFVRINNHEHTDVQEYLGSYASDPDSGRLVFHEGLLVKALRRGDWIVLDELNLAPTDVLEALNRLLDDNRELIIPETGEVVRPHPHFMLFATQNPPGIYAGRKVLSRAFRNRFLEIHFDDVPRPELEVILTNRCAIPPSYAAKVVAVFVELQKRRQAGRVFDTKQAFVTLRDLFRWGQREAQGYQQLAENGYMLIAERARRADDKAVVKDVIEDIMKVKIDTDALYDIHGIGRKAIAQRIGSRELEIMLSASKANGIVWTKAMQRLLCLVAFSLKYDEPVLLVGETGSGKTSVCELLAKAFGTRLFTVNCHQNTDTADLLGGQRPLRNRGTLQAKARAEGLSVLQVLDSELIIADDGPLTELAEALARQASQTSDARLKAQAQAAIQAINGASALFEWQDGPLVEAMRSGDHLLLDEISLADDSVLERLNSVLEPGRTLVLAEKSGASKQSSEGLDAAQIRASDGFQVVATMNPGGDYGKKELSPALRNRFTEIWVPQVDDREDILQIFEAQWKDAALISWGSKILDFVDWFALQIGGKDQAGIGLRDLLSWVTFINSTVVSPPTLSPPTAFAQGGMLAFVDGVGAMSATSAMTSTGLQVLRGSCLNKIADLCGSDAASLPTEIIPEIVFDADRFGIGAFSIPRGPAANYEQANDFSFQAATTAQNALKVMRALYVPNKAILLEGSPGAGKTSLITALAKASGNVLTRINLSDQTELTDLFGADLPVEGSGAGEFAWKDAAFLKAMQNGEWVLLDEMNLASQAVLEGLNSCLDHRGAVYIPELGRSFDKHPDFKLFAAQNPHQQGGGRKGLPKSFLNRFTKVFVDELQATDILAICSQLYPHFAADDLAKMIRFNALLHEEVMVKHTFGRQGAPWEFNLRDLLRWLSLVHADVGLNWKHRPIDHLGALFIQRFRSAADRRAAAALFQSVFEVDYDPDARPWPSVTPRHVQFGHGLLTRQPRASLSQQHFSLLQHHLPALESLADCVRLQWLSILVGPAGGGKTSLVRMMAHLAGAQLEEMRMSSAVDTMDVLGTFEQADNQQKTRQLLRAISRHLELLPSREAQAAHAVSSDLGQTTALDADYQSRLKVFVTQLFELASFLGDAQLTQLTQAIADHAANQKSTNGRFEWSDGPLLRAMQEGSWLLLDDANLCSASVLDRLNSLFEPGGSLVLSERGVIDGEILTIRPHPDFRLFMALDPQHGELSRAMRNRGLEICIREAPVATEAVDDARMRSLDAFSPCAEDPELAQPLGYADLAQAQHASSLLEGDHSQEAVEAYVASALPVSLHGLASHVIAASSSKDGLLQLNSLLSKSATHQIIEASKASWGQVRQVDTTFLLDQGLNLSCNNALYDEHAVEQSVVRGALNLISGGLTIRRQLFQAAQSASQRSRQLKMLSILQRSALTNSQRQEEDEATAEGRLLYPFMQALEQAVFTAPVQPGISVETLRSMTLLLERCKYLLVVCQQSTFDYSSVRIVVSAIQEILQELAQHGLVALETLHRLASALHYQVTLTSGLAMEEIWEAFIPRVPFAEALRPSEALWRTLSTIKRTEANRQLISSAVDVAATLLLPTGSWTSAHQEEILALAGQTLGRLQGEPHTNADQQSSRSTSWEAPALATVHLQIQALAEASGMTPSLVSEAVKEVLAASDYPLQLAVAIRKEGWLMSTKNRKTQAALDGALSWVQALSDSVGCEMLFRPFLLYSSVFPTTASRVSMGALTSNREEFRRLARLTTLTRPSSTPTRQVAVQREIFHLTARLLVSLQSSIGRQTSDLPSRSATLKELKSWLHDKEAALVEQEDLTESDARSTAISTILSALFEAARQLLDHAGNDLSALGCICVSIALMLVKLYLPNIAIDPLASSRTREAMAQDQSDRLQARLNVARHAERLTTGCEDSPLISSISAAHLAAQEARISVENKSSLSRQPDVALLKHFFDYVHSFTRQALDESKLGDLVKQLDQHCDDQAVARENSLQSSLQSFARRLSSEYAALSDLTAPLLLSIDLLRLGFRSLRTGRMDERVSSSKKRNGAIVDALVRFPTTVASERFTRLELPVGTKTGSSQLSSLAVPMLLCALGAFNRELAEGKPMSSILRPLGRTYEQLFFIWTLDKEQERKDEEAQNSLFKSRKHDIEDKDDEAVQEAEFKSMFPEYSDVLDEDVDEQVKTTSKTSVLVKAEHLDRLRGLHLCIFSDDCPVEEAASFSTARRDLIRSLLRSSYDPLPEGLDKQSAAYQLSLLAEQTGLADDASKTPNFYIEANVTETLKSTRIVQRTRARLEEIIKEWPDQMVLQHIRDRCDAILSLDSASPVAKILAALEQLLAHTEDWEGYASSSNNLSAQRSEIIEQIIAWRRLELSSWARLLETQAQLFSGTVGEWWFRLYEVAIRGMQSAMGESEAKGLEHLRSMVGLLDEFVRTSSIGNFEARLKMVDSFGRYLVLLTQNAPATETKGLDRVARVFRNVSLFYAQFRTTVASSFDKQRSAIEKEIRDFIQLASWKDVNIHALKQSAQKSHRKLHKCVRKFREVLRQPIDPILAGASENRAPAADVNVTPASAEVSSFDSTRAQQLLAGLPLPSDSGLQLHIQNLPRTFDVLQTKIQGPLASLLRAVHQEGIEQLAGEIVSRSQKLASTTPSLATETNQKAIKNLTRLKERAWVDLLRELQRVGLSSSVSTDMAAQNRDPSYVYEQPVCVGPEFDRVNRTFFHLLTALPHMRESLHSAHGDIRMDQLRRGANYCEYAMHLIFKERSRAAQLMPTKSDLQTLVGRLSDLQKDDTASLCGAEKVNAVKTLDLALQRSKSVLSEIIVEAPRHCALSALSGGQVDQVKVKLSQLLQETSSLAFEVRDLSQKFEHSDLKVWTQSEAALPERALALLSAISEELLQAHQSVPAIEALCIPARAWFNEQHQSVQEQLTAGTGQGQPVNAAQVSKQCNDLISSVLLIAQELGCLPPLEVSEEGDISDGAIRDDLRKLSSADRSLRAHEMCQQIHNCLRAISSSDGNDGVQNIRRITPFIASYSKLVASHLDSSLGWLKSFLRLTLVVTNTVTSLAQKGFCKPPEQDQSKEADGGEGKELEGGTGLGDGTGAQDITDQMEEEETIEELQKGEDDQEQGEKGDTEREKGAREAEEDFGGDLEDISADENEDGADESGDEGEQQEPDEHVGDVDPLDPNAVDEKVWSGDQDDKPQSDGKDETQKDVQGEEGENEDSAPKEDGGKQDQSRKEAASERQEQQKGKENEAEQGEETEEDQQDANAEDGDEELDAQEDAGEEPQGLGRKLEDDVDAGENLDLDEDLKMSDQEGEGASDNEDDLGDMDLGDDDTLQQQDQEEQRGQDLEGEEDLTEQFEKTESGPEQQELEPSEAEVAKNAGEEAMDQEEEAAEDDEEAAAQGQEAMGADTQQGPPDADMADGQSELDPSAAEAQESGDVASSAKQSQGAKSQQGRPAQSAKPTAPEGNKPEDAGGDKDEQDPQEDAGGPSTTGSKSQQPQDEQGEGEQADGEDDSQTNPMRSLGDALKEFRRNLDSIGDINEAAENEEQKADAKGEGMPEEGDVEHVANNEDAEMQALGAADQEDVQQGLNQSTIDDQDAAAESKPPGIDEAGDVEMQDVPTLERAPLPDFDQEEDDHRKSTATAADQAQQQDKKALMPSDVDTQDRRGGFNEESVLQREDVEDAPTEEEEELIDPIPEDERSEAGHSVEQQLLDFRSLPDEERLAKAADLWRSYATLTSDLAFALCEQLRLILTPTLAARLNGDFRTGKRLNMRKIVPFIASDFAKDKIWLRRTKPSKREYQVLLAVDDSRSMAENRSVHLAYQTLALVSGALSRLEVGDISICRFGETVQTLHPFGKGTFGDDSGAQVLEQLSFEQKGTNMVRLIEHTLDSLQQARNSKGSSSASSSAELWQLEIIISDGVCQDHDRLRALLRRANEQRVMIVFVIVDSLAQQQQPSANGKKAASTGGKSAAAAASNSILSMSSVRYEVDPQTGKLELKMDRYLDSFPFTYYVVLREAEALPEVLATTLKQWMEKTTAG